MARPKNTNTDTDKKAPEPTPSEPKVEVAYAETLKVSNQNLSRKDLLTISTSIVTSGLRTVYPNMKPEGLVKNSIDIVLEIEKQIGKMIDAAEAKDDAGQSK